MTPTPEQSAILADTSKVLIIHAGPGCGKSTTMALKARTLPSSEHRYTYALAFNRDAVADLRSKFPSACRIATLNSLGHTIWERNLGPQIPVNVTTRKSADILNSLRDSGESIDREEFEDLKTLLRWAKSQGYLPPSSGAHFKAAPSFKGLCELANLPPEQHLKRVLDRALALSIEQAYRGLIDFDDQGYMSALFAEPRAFPEVKHLFVDEAQDLTPLQIRLIKRLATRSSLTIVGDPLQAIYAFRGALSDSFARIMETWPDATTLPLQTSFRLPTEMVQNLQEHNPQLRTKKLGGMVANLDWTAPIDEIISTQFKSGPGAILCRNNAPLYRAALACIASHVRFNLNDNGFGYGLIRDIKRAGPLRQPISALLPALANLWASQPQDLVHDKVSALGTLSVFCNADSASALCKSIEALLQRSNPSDSAHPVFLSTAHKAKGLEFEWVLHLDPHLIPSHFAKTAEDHAQEANIRYVIESRPRSILLRCSSDQILIPGAPRRSARPPISGAQPL